MAVGHVGFSSILFGHLLVKRRIGIVQESQCRKSEGGALDRHHLLLERCLVADGALHADQAAHARLERGTLIFVLEA